MNVLGIFEKQFCDRLISLIDLNKCYNLDIYNPKGEETKTKELLSTNAIQFDIPTNSDENTFVNELIYSKIENVIEIKNVIHIIDNNKKYIPNKYSNNFVCMCVLNDNFTGGRMSIGNQINSIKMGEFISLTPNDVYNVEPILSGERICLLSYVDTKIKNEKSLI